VAIDVELLKSDRLSQRNGGAGIRSFDRKLLRHDLYLSSMELCAHSRIHFLLNL
jgi:hypothetical protein